MRKLKNESQDEDTILSPEAVSAIVTVWSELGIASGPIDPSDEKLKQLLSRLVQAERCLKLASKLETPGNFAVDTTPHREELRQIVILQLEALAEYDDPHAKAMADKLNNLIERWSA